MEEKQRKATVSLTVASLRRGPPTHALQIQPSETSAYLKDNCILPRGFDKRTAPGDVAVHGEAFADPDFGAGEDRVRYLIDVAGAPGPFVIEAQLWYQSIAYRWAENLRVYRAVEPQRFVSYYDQMAPESAIMLARAASTAQP
jgi:hypothetical protein